MTRLVCVAPDRVELIWPHVATFVDRSCAKYGTKDERRELEESVKTGKALLWIVWSGVVECITITDLVKEDDYLVCRIRALAGKDMRRWLGFLPDIEKYALAEGCEIIRYIGREGWRRVMPKDYRVTHIIASRRLKDY